jgi:3-hydroxyisobutyrate dehydrogenase-like beta-hydroxyacid dehydrogenase
VSDVIAVLGLGEAGSLLARDLVAAGAAVRGFDPKVPAPPGVTGAGSDAEAVAGATLVLSVNSAGEAVNALEASIGALRPGAVWADLNTAAPGVKRRLAEIGEGRGVPVTDIAMMAPVPGNGLRVPMLASGDGAADAAKACAGTGRTSTSWPARPAWRPPGSCCAAFSTRAWPPPSSRPSRRPGRPALMTG